MTIKHYEVQTNTVAQGWVNAWHENDKPIVFAKEVKARRAIREFFEDLPDQMCANYSESDYRVQPITFDELVTIDEGDTMAQIASKLQTAISTPELRDLIDELADLYEPTEDMAEDGREWPACFGGG